MNWLLALALLQTISTGIKPLTPEQENKICLFGDGCQAVRYVSIHNAAYDEGQNSTSPAGPTFSLAAVNTVEQDTQFMSQIVATARVPNATTPVLWDYTFTLKAGWACAAFVFIGVDGAGISCTTYPNHPVAATVLTVPGLRPSAQCLQYTNAYDSGGNPTIVTIQCGNMVATKATVR